MKYAWIKHHHAHWPITLQCAILNVSVGGYIEHQRRKDTHQSKQAGKRLHDDALLIQTKAAHAASK